MVNSVLRPRAWPSFKTKDVELMQELSKIKEWRLELERKANNTSASLIANSVTFGGRSQSYVARGAPTWFQGAFGSERNISSG